MSLVICNVFLVICILEGSGKWPDSIDAIRRLKAAYYLSLSQALGKIAPSVLSAAYTSYLEVYKVCSKIVVCSLAQSRFTYSLDFAFIVDRNALFSLVKKQLFYPSKMF